MYDWILILNNEETVVFVVNEITLDTDTSFIAMCQIFSERLDLRKVIKGLKTVEKVETKKIQNNNCYGRLHLNSRQRWIQILSINHESNHNLNFYEIHGKMIELENVPNNIYQQFSLAINKELIKSC